MAKTMIQNGKLVRLQTQPVTTCDGCGACCRHMGTPPGYAAYYPIGAEITEWAKQSPNYERWKNLPAEVEAALRSYYYGVKVGAILDRTRELVDDQQIATALREGRLEWVKWQLHKAANNTHPISCLWYDEDAHRCRHYEHRPQTCREAIDPGDEACLATRRAFRIPLPLA